MEVLFYFVLAFFTACYRPRDWLLQDGPSTRADLDGLFASSAPLRLSGDIANIAKHFNLIPPPRAGRQLSFAREYVPGSKGWFGRDGQLVGLSDREKVDVLEARGGLRSGVDGVSREDQASWNQVDTSLITILSMPPLPMTRLDETATTAAAIRHAICLLPSLFRVSFASARLDPHHVTLT